MAKLVEAYVRAHAVSGNTMQGQSPLVSDLQQDRPIPSAMRASYDTSVDPGLGFANPKEMEAYAGSMPIMAGPRSAVGNVPSADGDISGDVSQLRNRIFQLENQLNTLNGEYKQTRDMLETSRKAYVAATGNRFTPGAIAEHIARIYTETRSQPATGRVVRFEATANPIIIDVVEECKRVAESIKTAGDRLTNLGKEQTSDAKDVDNLIGAMIEALRPVYDPQELGAYARKKVSPAVERISSMPASQPAAGPSAGSQQPNGNHGKGRGQNGTRGRGGGRGGGRGRGRWNAKGRGRDRGE